MTLKPARYEALTKAEHGELAKQIATQVNARINAIRNNDVKTRLVALFGNRPLNALSDDAAIADVKTLQENLSRSAEVKNRFGTAQTIKDYRDQFANVLQNTYTVGPETFDVSESNADLQLAAAEAERDARAAEGLPEPAEKPKKADDGETFRRKTTTADHPPAAHGSGEKPPAPFLSLKGLGRNALLGTAGFLGMGALSNAGPATIVGQTPVLSQLAGLSNSVGATVTSAVAGGPAWLAPSAATIGAYAGPLVGAAAGLTGLWALGRGWEAIQRSKWFQKAFHTGPPPYRSVAKRIWVGATVPFRIAGRTLQFVGGKLWNHKWPLLGGLTLGAILASGGLLTPAGGVVVGLAGGAASAALPPEKESGGGGGHH